MLNDELYDAVIDQVTGVLLLPVDTMAQIVVSNDQSNKFETIKIVFLDSPWYNGGSTLRKTKVLPFTAIKISAQLTNILNTFRSKISLKSCTSGHKNILFKNVVLKLFNSISKIVGVEKGGVAVIFYQDIFILLLLIEYLFC